MSDKMNEIDLLYFNVPLQRRYCGHLSVSHTPSNNDGDIKFEPNCNWGYYLDSLV